VSQKPGFRKQRQVEPDLLQSQANFKVALLTRGGCVRRLQVCKLPFQGCERVLEQGTVTRVPACRKLRLCVGPRQQQRFPFPQDVFFPAGQPRPAHRPFSRTYRIGTGAYVHRLLLTRNAPQTQGLRCICRGSWRVLLSTLRQHRTAQNSEIFQFHRRRSPNV